MLTNDQPLFTIVIFQCYAFLTELNYLLKSIYLSPRTVIKSQFFLSIPLCLKGYFKVEKEEQIRSKLKNFRLFFIISRG